MKIVVDDYRFTTWAGSEPLKYMYADGCRWGNPAGDFTVDLTGTGFLFSSLVKSYMSLPVKKMKMNATYSLQRAVTIKCT